METGALPGRCEGGFLRYCRAYSRRLRLILLVATLALTASGCRVSRETKPGGEIRIAVGSATDIVYLPTTLAQRLGYYRNEGLNVRIIDTAAGSKSLEALLGGSVEVVTGFYDHTIQMAAEGRPIQAFVLLAQYP